MAKERVSIDDKLIQRLYEYYSKSIDNEFNLKPTNSQLVEIALSELEAYKKNKEINIYFTKKGKRLIIK
jgi:hypothetical protein